MTGLNDPAAFYDHLRAGKYLGPVLTADEVKGCVAITEACGVAGWSVGYTAYALATAWLETANTMQPVKEIGGDAYFRRRYDIEGLRPDKARELGNTTPGDGLRFAGRGYAQATGRANYDRLDKRLGLKGLLLANPEMAMKPAIAADMMIVGMGEGLFTGKKLANYLPLTGPGSYDAFLGARRVINGQDRAAEIAAAALHFQAALTAGRWA